jgi:hypothetical protein
MRRATKSVVRGQSTERTQEASLDSNTPAKSSKEFSSRRAVFGITSPQEMAVDNRLKELDFVVTSAIAVGSFRFVEIEIGKGFPVYVLIPEDGDVSLPLSNFKIVKTSLSEELAEATLSLCKPECIGVVLSHGNFNTFIIEDKPLFSIEGEFRFPTPIISYDSVENSSRVLLRESLTVVIKRLQTHLFGECDANLEELLEIHQDLVEKIANLFSKVNAVSSNKNNLYSLQGSLTVIRSCQSLTKLISLLQDASLLAELSSLELNP